MDEINNFSDIVIKAKSVIRFQLESFIIFAIILYVICWYFGLPFLLLLLFYMFVEVLVSFIHKGVYYIEFKKDILIVQFFNKFRKVEKIYSYKSISFSKEPRLVGRGHVTDVLCIYINDILEYKLHTSYNVFFKDDQLNTIEENLEKVVPRRPKKKSWS